VGHCDDDSEDDDEGALVGVPPVQVVMSMKVMVGVMEVTVGMRVMEHLLESPPSSFFLVTSRYWKTACCLLAEGWSMGRSLTFLSLPMR